MRSLMMFLIVAITATSASSQTTPIPHGLESVAVIIERWDANGSLMTRGTGFFYKDGALGESFLVTNRHVFVDLEKVQVRFNTAEGSAKKYTLTLVDSANNPYWRMHPDTTVDLAVMQLPLGIKIFVIHSRQLKPSSEVSLGDVVYFIGFPLTERTSDEKVYPLLRHGVVSYVVKEKLAVGNPPTVYPKGTILIDATSLGGNSGGLVISTPKTGTTEASFIGVISGHLAGGKYAENMDLGTVVPAEYLPEVIAEFGRK